MSDPVPRRGLTGSSPSGGATSWWSRLSGGLGEFYRAPYRRTFARAQRDEDDLLMLLVLGDTLGIPNPASYYTLELLPVLHEQFHDWHRRMGLPRSPLDHIACC